MRNAGKLGRNPRMAMIYRTLARMPAGQRNAIAASAQVFLDRVAPRD
jgi:deoxyribodipyrimidine photolyase-like uncharacterized protein